MSQYGYLVCHDCRQMLFLGKLVQPSVNPVYFHVGGADLPPNSRKPELTRAVWRFLAGHAGHSIGVVTDFDDDFDDVAKYADIGGDSSGDISLDEFLKGFPG